MFAEAWKSIRRVFGRAQDQIPSPVVDLAAVEDVCKEFFSCRTWEATRSLLDQYPHLLLSDAALHCFFLMRTVVTDTGRLELVPVIDERRSFLVQCRRAGRDAAVKNLPRCTRMGVLERLGGGEFEDMSEESVPLVMLKEMLHAILLQSDTDTEVWDEVYEALMSRYAQQAGAIFEPREERVSRQLRLGRLCYERGAFAKTDLENFREAADALSLGIQTFGEIGHAKGLALTTYSLATVHMLLGEGEMVLPLLADSVNYAEQCNFIAQIAQSRRMLGKRMMAANRVDEARSQVLESLELATHAGERDEAMATATALMQLATQTGDQALESRAIEVMTGLAS
jgi:hypothetical protein